MSSPMMTLANELQLLAHKYGYEDFRDAVTQACYQAMEDTLDFEDQTLHKKYQYLGSKVNDAAIDEPEFSHVGKMCTDFRVYPVPHEFHSICLSCNERVK